VVDDGVDQGRKCGLVAEHALLDGGKDLLELRVEFMFTVVVVVAKVLNVFGQSTKQEDVLITSLAGDFNLAVCL
jgi:hypothetical protein